MQDRKNALSPSVARHQAVPYCSLAAKTKVHQPANGLKCTSANKQNHCTSEGKPILVQQYACLACRTCPCKVSPHHITKTWKILHKGFINSIWYCFSGMVASARPWPLFETLSHRSTSRTQKKGSIINPFHTRTAWTCSKLNSLQSKQVNKYVPHLWVASRVRNELNCPQQKCTASAFLRDLCYRSPACAHNEMHSLPPKFQLVSELEAP